MLSINLCIPRISISNQQFLLPSLPTNKILSIRYNFLIAGLYGEKLYLPVLQLLKNAGTKSRVFCSLLSLTLLAIYKYLKCWVFCLCWQAILVVNFLNDRRSVVPGMRIMSTLSELVFFFISYKVLIQYWSHACHYSKTGKSSLEPSHETYFDTEARMFLESLDNI